MKLEDNMIGYFQAQGMFKSLSLDGCLVLLLSQLYLMERCSYSLELESKRFPERGTLKEAFMGLLKTTKLDNGMVGFECIYGGMEAPFGGIDASNTNPRYIDPKCFVDASNFLLINGELCSFFTSGINLFPTSLLPPSPPANWNPWPLLPTSANPGVLLGVGKLQTENVTKNWAL